LYDNGNPLCYGLESPQLPPQFASELVPNYISKIPQDPLYPNQTGDYLFYDDAKNITICAYLEQPATPASYNYSDCIGGTVYSYCSTLPWH
jgi:hypothetical protein